VLLDGRVRATASTLFYGHICGELIRRSDGRSLGAFWRDEVASSWRLDFDIGLSAAELARTADVEGELVAGDGELRHLALSNPPASRPDGREQRGVAL
jgi:hypothetical protein